MFSEEYNLAKCKINCFSIPNHPYKQIVSFDCHKRLPRLFSGFCMPKLNSKGSVRPNRFSVFVEMKPHASRWSLVGCLVDPRIIRTAEASYQSVGLGAKIIVCFGCLYTIWCVFESNKLKLGATTRGMDFV